MISWWDLIGSLDTFPSRLQHQVLQGKLFICLLSLSCSQETCTSRTNTLPDGGVTHNWTIILEGWVPGLMNTPGTGKWLFSPPFSSGEITSGVLCPVQGSPVQGRHWETRARQANSPRVVEHRTFRENLGQPCLLSLNKRRQKAGRRVSLLSSVSWWAGRETREQSPS